MKVEVCLCDTSDFDTIEREVRKGCKLLYLESPTNPTLKVVDIERLAKAAHAAGAVVVVDNTFATPINQKPLALGADLVVYSATKYLNGHSDVMGGLAVGSKQLIDAIYHYREITGATLHPQSAYMILRGMKTLELRMQRHNENGMKVAQYLAQHAKVEAVFYPGLETHRNHAIAKRQMTGFGGMLSFSLKGGFPAVVKALESAAVRPQGGQPGFGRHARRPAAHDEPCRAEREGTRRRRHPGGPDPLFGRHRERRRPDRRPRAGAEEVLNLLKVF